MPAWFSYMRLSLVNSNHLCYDHWWNSTKAFELFGDQNSSESNFPEQTHPHIRHSIMHVMHLIMQLYSSTQLYHIMNFAGSCSHCLTQRLVHGLNCKAHSHPRIFILHFLFIKPCFQTDDIRKTKVQPQVVDLCTFYYEKLMIFVILIAFLALSPWFLGEFLFLCMFSFYRNRCFMLCAYEPAQKWKHKPRLSYHFIHLSKKSQKISLSASVDVITRRLAALWRAYNLHDYDDFQPICGVSQGWIQPTFSQQLSTQAKMPKRGFLQRFSPTNCPLHSHSFKQNTYMPILHI